MKAFVLSLVVTAADGCGDNSAITAATLAGLGVSTYVVALDASEEAEAAADELAAAGGTTAAMIADSPAELATAITGLQDELESLLPTCSIP